MSGYSDLELQEQLMNQLEEMQTEIDQYKQTIADLQNGVSKKDSQLSEVLEQAETLSRENSRIQSELMNEKKKSSLALSNLEQLNKQLELARQSANSSQVQELVSTVQQQKKKIAEQAELIEKLNGSDLVLKENEKLKKQNSDLQRSEQNARQEAMTEVTAVKREYARKEQELAQTQAEANRARIDAEATRKHQNELVKDKAMEMYHSKEKSLISAYKGKEMALEGAFFGSLAYGFLVTVLTAIGSQAFVSDFKSFFVAIWEFITLFADFAIKLANTASQLGDMIPQPIVAVIVHWLLLILVLVLMAGGLGVLVVGGVIYLFKGYTEKLEFADNLSLLVFLVSLALSIFFAEEIRAVVPVNLILLNILVHALYVLVRWYVKGCRESRGYY